MRIDILNYKVNSTPDKTIISFETSKQGIKRGYITVAFSLLIIFLVMLADSNIGMALFGVVLIALGGVLGIIVGNNIRKKRNKNRTIVVDKKNGILQYRLDNFSIKTKEIKDIIVEEDTNVLRSVTNLKIIMDGGVKIIPLPMTFSSVKKIREVIIKEIA